MGTRDNRTVGPYEMDHYQGDKKPLSKPENGTGQWIKVTHLAIDYELDASREISLRKARKGRKET